MALTTTVHDVADFLRHSVAPESAWAMQKLLYYCQAWSLVWDRAPMFAEDFEAWRDGPVCPEARTSTCPGDRTLLSPAQRATATAVAAAYGRKPGNWLIELTHRERPWLEARGDLPTNAKSTAVIRKDSIAAYYESYGVPPKTFSSGFMDGLDLLVTTPPEVLDAKDAYVDAEPFVNWLETGGPMHTKSTESSG